MEEQEVERVLPEYGFKRTDFIPLTGVLDYIDRSGREFDSVLGKSPLSVRVRELVLWGYNAAVLTGTIVGGSSLLSSLTDLLQ